LSRSGRPAALSDIIELAQIPREQRYFSLAVLDAVGWAVTVTAGSERGSVPIDGPKEKIVDLKWKIGRAISCSESEFDLYLGAAVVRGRDARTAQPVLTIPVEGEGIKIGFALPSGRIEVELPRDTTVAKVIEVFGVLSPSSKDQKLFCNGRLLRKSEGLLCDSGIENGNVIFPGGTYPSCKKS
jgi:hypothetical protein